VPFNTLKCTSNEFYKQNRIDNNKAGSSCPKKFLALSKEFGPEGVCTASKKYQDVKLEALDTKKETMTSSNYEMAKNKITEKACLCVGLANASYLENEIPIKGQQQGVVICPGPNLAYFDKEVSLSQMVDHIYGKASVLSEAYRPNMFVKELKMYVEYLKNDIATFTDELSAKNIKKWTAFRSNLLDGIAYYQNLFDDIIDSNNNRIQSDIMSSKNELNMIEIPVL
jgi:hypothetical protein